MTIERLSLHDVPEVAALHGEALGGLLSRLGSYALRAYYMACARSVSATGFVARDSAGLQGFVLGAANPAELRREVVAREPIRIMSGVLLGVLRLPESIPWLLKSFIAALHNCICRTRYTCRSPSRPCSWRGRSRSRRWSRRCS